MALRWAALLVNLLRLDALAAAPPHDVYLLMGQSNMSGRGVLAELPAIARSPDPRILLYGNDGRWRVATEPLDDAAGQIDAVTADPLAAVGPGLAFARAMVEGTGRSVALVPCAKGGSAIAEWRPAMERDTLYGSCFARAREAGGRIAGILWYQGESDTKAAATARTWRRAFETLIRQFRADLGAPRLPLVFVQLADRPGAGIDPTYPFWREVQREQARTRLICARMVPARGLALNPDGLHLSTAAQQLLGARLARAMQRTCRWT